MNSLPQQRVFKLNLTENEITSIQIVDHPALQYLEARKNQLIAPQISLSGCTNLVELYLAENNIESLDFFAGLPGLKKLHLRANKIEKIGNPESSYNLEYLNLRENQIASMGELLILERFPYL